MAVRDKKAFLNEQCKEVEGNNIMGRTRDFFKKIGDIQGTLYARMGIIKVRNSKDPTEAEETKKMCKNTQKKYTKKGLNDPDNHDGVVTHFRLNTDGHTGV